MNLGMLKLFLCDILVFIFKVFSFLHSLHLMRNLKGKMTESSLKKTYIAISQRNSFNEFFFEVR